MKTLPAAIEAGKAGNSKRIILFRIIPEPTDTWTEFLWATQEITITDWGGGGTYKKFLGGILAEGKLGRIQESIDVGKGGNVATVSNLSFEIANPEYSGEDRFDQSFALHNLENRTCEIYLAFYTGSTLAYPNILKHHTFLVEDVSYNYETYKIELRDAQAKRHKDIPDLVLDDTNYPRTPRSNKGLAVPLVYGNQIEGDFKHHDKNLVPAYKCDTDKVAFIMSRNKTAISPRLVFHDFCLYFSDINRYALIYPRNAGANFGLSSDRPSTLSLPYGHILKATFWSQGQEQGSRTDPWDLDLSNVTDNDDSTGLILTSGQKLFLKFPVPTVEFAHILEESKLKLVIQIGTINTNFPSAVAIAKYFNPDTFLGEGGGEQSEGRPSNGVIITGDYQNKNFVYKFGLDKTAHGKSETGMDQYDPWTLNEIQTYDFGIDVYDWTPSIEIKNMYLELEDLIFEARYAVSAAGLKIQQERQKRRGLTGGLYSTDIIFIPNLGENFGDWISDKRNNGLLGSTLIETGAYIIECILRNELGLTSAEIDVESFDLLGNVTSGERKNWKLAGNVDSQDNSLDVIKGLCRELCIGYFCDYQNKESVIALKKQTAVKTIDRETICEGKIAIKFSDLDLVYNKFYIHYKKNNNDTYDSTKFLTAADHNLISNDRAGTPDTYTGLCADSQTKYNTTKKFEIKCNWIRDDATADLLCRWLAEWFCYRHFIPEFSAGLDHIELEMGDQIKLNHTLLPTGVSDDDSFMIWDIDFDMGNDNIGYKLIQIPDLLE